MHLVGGTKEDWEWIDEWYVCLFEGLGLGIITVTIPERHRGTGKSE